MALTPDALALVAQQAANAGHGEKEAVYQRFCEQYNVNRSTLMRQLRAVRPSTRKRRSDFGKIALSYEEAEVISGLLMTTPRAHGKETAGIETALKTLRANQLIKAERVDQRTGEILLLSKSAISRSLYHYNLHPEQLRQPKPVMSMRSLHPNHVWQIDPSICVLYYLDEQKSGLNVMGEAEFYKNKPGNFDRVAKQRVWRYVLTDHTSGFVYVQYVLGGETTQNLCDVFINAMQKKEDAGLPFHGVPKIVMLDKGSANQSFPFKRLCEQLGIQMLTHEKGNPRAKGQVEKANDIVERDFEWGLKFIRVNSIAQLNHEAHKWMVLFNQSAVHSRTKRTRCEVWQQITPQQLVIAPSVEICRELAVSATKQCKIYPNYTLKFKGQVFDVKPVKNIVIGSKVEVSSNPWRENCAQVRGVNEEGNTFWTVIEPIVVDDFGFNEAGAIWGEEYKTHAQGILQDNAKRVKRLVMGAQTDEELDEKIKAKALPFEGKLEPYKHIAEHKTLDFLPKRGQEHELTTNAKLVELQPLTVIEAAKQGKARYGERWGADNFNWLNQHYPDGIQQEEWEQLLTRNEPPGTRHLYVVNS
jgi:hypothetical protein